MHHAAGLRAALRQEGRGGQSGAEIILRGRAVNPEVCSPRERAMIDFAIKLTKGRIVKNCENMGVMTSTDFSFDPFHSHSLSAFRETYQY